MSATKTIELALVEIIKVAAGTLVPAAYQPAVAAAMTMLEAAINMQGGTITVDQALDTVKGLGNVMAADDATARAYAETILPPAPAPPAPAVLTHTIVAEEPPFIHVPSVVIEAVKP